MGYSLTNIRWNLFLPGIDQIMKSYLYLREGLEKSDCLVKAAKKENVSSCDEAKYYILIIFIFSFGM